jgi:hypothetical protein
MQDDRALCACCDHHKDELFAKAGVVGVGVGIKEKDGRPTGEPCVVVMVAKKRPLEELNVSDIVPSSVIDFGSPVEGVEYPTDVVEVGVVKALSWPGKRLPASVDTDLLREGLAARKALKRREKDGRFITQGLLDDLLELLEELCGDRPPPRTGRHRPAPPGVSVGHEDITAGTLGLWVVDKGTGEDLMLSNNHVLAVTNAGEPGEPILQPGRHDGGRPGDDTIATLERFVPIENGALVDAAVAKPLRPDVIAREVLEVGLVNLATTAAVGMDVKKSGRTTGLTRGRINAVNVSVRVEYGNGRRYRFNDQLQITPGSFSDGGDSGSLVVTDEEEAKAVGLLFAGSDFVTIASRIEHVFSLLNVGLAL